VNGKPEVGYCVKCRAKTTIAEAAEHSMKNGRPAIKGKCEKCGTGMFKILPGKGK
jgi:RNase P subunit RPR2